MMRKEYTAAFKAKVVQELLKEEKTWAQIATAYEVHPIQLEEWRARALEGLPSLFEKHDYGGKTSDVDGSVQERCPRLTTHALQAYILAFTFVDKACHIYNAAGIAPLVVVPADDVNHTFFGQCSGHQSIHNARMTIATKIT